MIETNEQQPVKSPISEAKWKSNRENALKSSGPKTEAGKRRSSLNATRSRLHGQIECLPAEDLAVYQKLLDEVIAEYDPIGPTERFHCTSAAQSMWRLQRAAALEQGIFAAGHREKIDSIAVMLRGAIDAQSQVGLMLNVRRANLDAVLAVLPALNSPTISHLSDPDWVAVNTIVEERTAREVIPRLKAANATGIVEYPLNKVVL